MNCDNQRTKDIFDKACNDFIKDIENINDKESIKQIPIRLNKINSKKKKELLNITHRYDYISITLVFKSGGFSWNEFYPHNRDEYRQYIEDLYESKDEILIYRNNDIDYIEISCAEYYDGKIISFNEEIMERLRHKL